MAAVETGFRALDEKSLVDYIKTIPSLVSKLGDQLEGLTIKEVGDGNLNFVYIVIGTSGGSFVIKQALPYVRLIGESWPMTKERAYFEALTLREHGRLCPEHVPEVYHFDRIMSLIAMRYLEPPHIILRKGLIAGIEYPLLAEHMSDYMAKTLFFTSMLYHSTTEHRQLVMAAVETGFRALDEKSLVDYIKTIPSLVSKLGDQLEGLTIKEVGDGNLNFVYIVIGTSGGSFVIKQALPYVRLIGESWPMTKERAYFEALTLREHGRLCPEHVPEVYHFDRIMSLIAMRYLEPPHIILRKGLIAGIEYPLLAEHMSDYMAKTLFFTSMLYHSTTEHRQLVAEYCGNLELCRLTEQVVFSDPYKESQYNRWTSPYLDQDAEAVRHDDLLKLEVAELKSMFIERAQALIHGDLHTSSVMVTHDSTQVIDPEFSVYGPMGYDIGAFIGNLIVSFFSQDGHSTLGNDRNSYKEWILKTIEDVWYLFQKNFTALWEEHKDGPGEAYLSAIYDSVDLLHLVQKKYMKDLFHDSLGFGAAKMIRRIVGVAHVEDFESIHDASSRADCERRALGFAKMLLKERRGFDTINQVVLAIQKLSP